jgi:hypothetical protein
VGRIGPPWTLYLVCGGSMGSAIPADSLIAVVPLGGEPAAGDVIAYRQREGGGVVVHRVVGREVGGVRTRGDANASSDPLVVADADLLGRVCWVSPLLGRVVRWLRGARRFERSEEP